jgi:tetratricopeptide (TPR) repeat protein
VIDLARQRFDEACAHDRAGRVEPAIACYEEALALGLPEPFRAQATLGLGSSYSRVLRHADAIAVLDAATAEYPDDQALRMFHALALWSAGREREGMQAMGRLALDTADLRGHRAAVSSSLDHLE